ncbi:NADPH:quinone reductase-like Zn-dependent oxidoreductase [Umezawaea tangerina]|uniref:NADPH:quinone reductase-like Zn-dependent oxidoreductase n=2 Tax=Umezawaea tangerina TaxID=84725 RepID=A0A2T0SZ15_9PSEU|nr:NADPH:quinone reductase-like Zn-dependent oxidoreductase [Umezawaea tangerina]
MTGVVVRAPGGPDVLQVEEMAAPTPAAGGVVVEVEAAGVAFGDVQLRQGRLPGKLPVVPGYDVVGRVSAVGPGVRGIAVGQRVAALTGTGGYATRAAARADRVVPVPEGLPAASVVALVLNYLTAWQMLHRAAAVRPGGSVLVLGAAGGVGSALVELAARDGIRVYGTASPRRHAALTAAGVTVVADQTAVPEPVDAVFDSVGGPSLAVSRRAAKPTGVVVGYGMSFAIAADLSKAGGLVRAVAALARAKLTPGPKVVDYLVLSSADRDPAAFRADLARLLDLLAEGAVSPVVTTMPLARAAEAHRLLEARQVVGKLVLVP